MDYHTLTVAELKRLCEERKLYAPSKAIKAILVSILDSHDNGVETLTHSPMKRGPLKRDEEDDSIIDIISDDDAPPSKLPKIHKNSPTVNSSKKAVVESPKKKQKETHTGFSSDSDVSVDAFIADLIPSLSSSSNDQKTFSTNSTNASIPPPKAKRARKQKSLDDSPIPTQARTARQSKLSAMGLPPVSATATEVVQPVTANETESAPSVRGRSSRVSRLQAASGGETSTSTSAARRASSKRVSSKKKKRDDDDDDEEEEEDFLTTGTALDDWIKPPRGGFNACPVCQDILTYTFTPNSEIVGECTESDVDPSGIVGVEGKLDCPYCCGKNSKDKQNANSTMKDADENKVENNNCKSDNNNNNDDDDDDNSKQWSHLDVDTCTIEWRSDKNLYLDGIKVEKCLLWSLPDRIKERCAEDAPENLLPLLFSSKQEILSMVNDHKNNNILVNSSSDRQNFNKISKNNKPVTTFLDISGVPPAQMASLLSRGFPPRLCRDAIIQFSHFDDCVNFCLNNLRTQIDNLIINKAAIASETAAANDNQRRAFNSRALLEVGDVSPLDNEFGTSIFDADGIRDLEVIARYLSGESSLQSRVHSGLSWWELLKMVVQARKFFKDAGDCYVKQMWDKLKRLHADSMLPLLLTNHINEKEKLNNAVNMLTSWVKEQLQELRRIMFEMPDEGGGVPLEFRKAMAKRTGDMVGLLLEGEGGGRHLDEDLDMVKVLASKDVQQRDTAEVEVMNLDDD